MTASAEAWRQHFALEKLGINFSVVPPQRVFVPHEGKKHEGKLGMISPEGTHGFVYLLRTRKPTADWYPLHAIYDAKTNKPFPAKIAMPEETVDFPPTEESPLAVKHGWVRYVTAFALFIALAGTLFYSRCAPERTEQKVHKVTTKK
jgi:hypothetical protein